MKLYKKTGFYNVFILIIVDIIVIGIGIYVSNGQYQEVKTNCNLEFGSGNWTFEIMDCTNISKTYIGNCYRCVKGESYGF
jgi:hypothetical protein